MIDVPSRSSLVVTTCGCRQSDRFAFFLPPDEEGGLWFCVLLGRAGGAELAIWARSRWEGWSYLVVASRRSSCDPTR
jgi:hypothetical protein